MSRKTGVLARQDTTLIGHELTQQIRILEVKGFNGEVDFRLWPRGSHFGERRPTAGPTLVGLLIWTGFTRHNCGLLDFPVHSMTAQSGVVLLQLKLFRFKFLVSCRGIARGRLALFTRFRAFNGYDFPGHKSIILYL